MESYEQFFLKNMAILQEGERSKSLCEPCSLKALSAIRFHGRVVLSPLLSPEQRREMCDYRQRAIRLEEHRQRQRRNSLAPQVQQRLDQTQLHRLPGEQGDKWPTPPRCPSPKPEIICGYTLVTDAPGLPRDPGPPTSHPRSEPPQCEPPSIVNGYNTEEEVREESDGQSEEDLSLDSLLKRSREYVQREQSRQSSKVIHKVSRTPPPDSLPNKENDGRSPAGNAGVQFGFSLHRSPVGPPQPRPLAQPSGPYDPHPHPSEGPSPSRSGPSPEPSLSPRTHRRRPRPVSTGNIHISFPIGPADLIPRSPGRSGEAAAQAEGPSAGSGRSPDTCGVVEGGAGGGSRRSSHCGTSPVQELRSPVRASGPSPTGQHDHVASGFRRRCHTLDSQLYPSAAAGDHIDRSQERAPRFMAGVTRLPPSRWSSPLNHSYDVENPSPCLFRPHVPAELPQAKHRMESGGPQGPSSSGKSGFRNAAEQQNSKTEETQGRVQTLEGMQKCLEEEHALQMSLLLAEHEKEQQRLRQDLEEKDRAGQGGYRALSEDPAGWECRIIRDSYAAPSPCCPGLSPAHTPAERSPGHNIGFPSPLSSSVSSPSVQPPVYLWGPTWGANKTRARLSQFLSVEQQRALCRLGAITRGFLTRRLLRTEKVKHLRQTVVDTQEFIRSFKTDSPQKRGTVSAQDLSLQDRVRAQLRAALYDVHDIFFEMPLGERLALLQQDRELRAERRLREMEKAKSPRERVVLSAATQRSLDRKKRVGESPAQARKVQPKPKSPTTNRMLKPSPGHSSPIPGQLNRQGSWYRKTPEDRVRRSDSLKKQHSLG